MLGHIVRRLRRARWAKRPFPPAWLEVVHDRLGFAADFVGDERVRFLQHLTVFAREKRFEGAGGLVITDEMRVVVAGCAARLSRNLSLDVWNDLGSVVIAPGDLKRDAAGRTLGLAHAFGTIVLSWSAVKHGLADDDDGHDVTVHELAHIFDLRDGGFDGTPSIKTPAEVRTFARAFSKAWLNMKRRPDASVLRAYAATNEAEFFAVATEAFFEKPQALQKRMPDVYAALKKVYRCDPAAS